MGAPRCCFSVEMKVLPQEIIQSPPWHPRFEEPTNCPPLGFARIHLIKDKDGIDDYLAKNIKGLSKQEAAAFLLFSISVSARLSEERRDYFLCPYQLVSGYLTPFVLKTKEEGTLSPD